MVHTVARRFPDEVGDVCVFSGMHHADTVERSIGVQTEMWALAMSIVQRKMFWSLRSAEGVWIHETLTSPRA